MASTRVKLNAREWYEIAPMQLMQITHNSGDTNIVYTELESQPSDFSYQTPVAATTHTGESVYFFNVASNCKIYAMPLYQDAGITITVGDK